MNCLPRALLRQICDCPVRLSQIRAAVVARSSIVLPLLLLWPVVSGETRAQSCTNTGSSGGESIAAQITIDAPGSTPLADKAVVKKGTRVRLDSVATSSGGCQSMAQVCGGCPCHVGPYYNRTIHHTTIWSDISSTGLNGRYSTGNVYGQDAGGTAFYNTLDTRASNSTGPIYSTLTHPGTYQYYFQAIINTTPCNLTPERTETVTIIIYVSDNDDSENNGEQSCPGAVGEPVNITNGNMYVRQTDYHLPGVGEDIDITRTYNSNSKRTGLFGYGWATGYEESIEAYGSLALRLNLADGRTVFFARGSVTEAFTPRQPLDFRGQVARNADTSYTLTLKDGTIHQFGGNGKLASITDRNNNQTTLTYDTNGKLTTITDASGRALTLSYTASGVVSAISDQMGAVTTYTYNSLKWLLTATYADNSQSKFTYDSHGGAYRLTTVKDALNNILETHAYDSQGRATTSEKHGGVERYTLNYLSATETHVTDALGHVTKYFFDKSKGRNVVTRVEGDCGCGGGSNVETWEYDNELNVTAKTDALNRTTSYTYDASGNRLTETNPRGTTTYTYNPLGQVLTITDAMNGVTTNVYDARGNLLSSTDMLNGATTYTYDARGLVGSVSDPRQNATQLTYDAYGNLTRITDALNNQTNFAYDTRGRLTTTTDASNNATAYTYDPAGRIKTVTRPGNAVVTFTYDLAGRRTKVKDARNNETTYAYDTAYRVTSITDAMNKSVGYTYDLMSNVTAETDQLGRVTNYTYDEFDRLTKITYPEASAGAGRLEERFTYDAAGNLTQRIDQANRTTTYAYDTSDRLTSTTDAALKETRYEYNARSHRTAVVDAIGQRYEFDHDALGRVTQVRRGGGQMTFLYDALGNRTRRTDYNGAITNYTYDSLNRLTTIAYPNATSATYGYDALSRLTTATNQHGAVSLAYDNLSRVSTTTDVWNQAVAYAYDLNGNRTETRLNAVLNAVYSYDALNRLTQLTEAGGGFTYGYDATSKLTSRTSPGGVAATYTYDGLDRLTRLKHTKGAATLADYQYQQNAVGNITQLTDQMGAHGFAYDVVDRLTSATHPAQPAENYVYDSVGNRTSSHRAATYQYQPFNKAVTIGATTHVYDANGNLTSKTDGAGTWQYTWDYENRLVQVTKHDAQTVTYKYDALGRRIERSEGGAWTRFTYDDADVVLDRNSDGSTVEYTNGVGTDEKLAQRSNGGGALYFVADHLGSTRALTDSSGNVIEQVAYDSFGDGAGSSLTRYSYTGRERDADTGLYYYRARWYDPQAGRFISEDPIEFEGGVNWYAYVGNDPVNLVDPLGLQDRTAPRGVPVPLGPFPTPDEYRRLGDELLKGLDALDKATDWDWIRRVRQRLGTDKTPADIIPPVPVPPLPIPIPPAACDPNIYSKGKESKSGSGKEKSTDIPSWAKGQRPNQGESGKDFADRVMKQRHPDGNYPKGPGSEFNKLKKFGDRAFKK